jgi:hypothetical protein
MAVYMITTEVLYKMHRLKDELEKKKANRVPRRVKWVLAALAAISIMIWG